MTAYELRISDWSSVVCSSDLADGAHQCDGLALHPGGFPPHSSLPSHLCPQCPSGFSTTTFTVIVPLVPKSNVRSKESPSAIGRFRSDNQRCARQGARASGLSGWNAMVSGQRTSPSDSVRKDRKSTRLNSRH